MSQSYGLDCPIAHALDIIGERWTLLILRDLFKNETRKYQELKHSLEGISPSMLSARLKKLEAAGIVVREMYTGHPPRAEYMLTPEGRRIGPILKSLHSWGETLSMVDSATK